MRPIVLASLALLAAMPVAAAPPSAILTHGLTAYSAGRYVDARRDFRALADDGSAIGETMLGTMYAHGQGVRRDPAAAAGYYSRAAHRGYAPAQLAFARALAHGQGVTVDRRAAWLWLRLAAKRGDARVVAAARAEATALAEIAPAPPDTTEDWRPWPSAGV